MAQVSTYAITPTIAEVLRECDAAWEETRKMIGMISDTEIYETLVSTHSELNKTYPIILSMMSTGDYSRKAAEKFFKYVQNNPWKDDEGHDETLTVYVAMCLRETHPHISRAELARAREDARVAMRTQKKAMKKLMDDAQERAEVINARRASARAADLRARVPADAAIIVQGERRGIKVSFDPSQ